MASAVKLDPELWEKIKKKYKNSPGMGGIGWNARKAQLAVKEYKRLGGRYGNKVPKARTSLHKWTAENWQYVDDNKNGRYLPEKVIKRLTPSEKSKENKNKKGKKGKRVPYSESVTQKMRNANIF
jgi:hypothetical protein